MSDILKADGFDDCIIGQCSRSGRLIYSTEKVIESLTKQMSYEEAVEYFYFNIEGAWVGEGTPIWCTDYDSDDDD
jgi:hypothetical protein